MESRHLDKLVESSTSINEFENFSNKYTLLLLHIKKNNTAFRTHTYIQQGNFFV